MDSLKLGTLFSLLPIKSNTSMSAAISVSIPMCTKYSQFIAVLVRVKLDNYFYKS